jgi:hypothetical protein
LITTVEAFVWSETGGCTDFGSVSANRQFATGSMSIPIASDGLGQVFSLSGTGAAAYQFGSSDVLCLALVNLGGAGANDLHLRVDTLASLGASGRSGLDGPFAQVESARAESRQSLSIVLALLGIAMGLGGITLVYVGSAGFPSQVQHDKS